MSFLSTLSLRRATRWVRSRRLWSSNFYPRSPCGERLCINALRKSIPDFYPRSPCGERRPALVRKKLNHYFYPRSPCGERRQPHHRHPRRLVISIHALLAESDAPNKNDRCPGGQFLSTLSLRRATSGRPETRQRGAISIHALLAESDPFRPCWKLSPCLFLSTLSLRRATASQTNLPSKN